MKAVLIGSAIVLSGLIGLNVGTEWGITARPTQTVAKEPTCESIQRYEDGTARCTYIIHDEDSFEAFAGHRVTEQAQDVFEVKTADKQETVNTMQLHPAESAYRLQKAEVQP